MLFTHVLIELLINIFIELYSFADFSIKVILNETKIVAVSVNC